MNQWIEFFLGTPKRTCWTLGLIASVTVIATPGLLARIADRLVTELAPLVNLVFIGAMVALGLRLLLSPLFGKKK